MSTKRRFCDVLAGRDPAAGVLVAIPPHRGPVTLSFELHNRHTYSEDLVKAKKAFRQYKATIGVLTLDNTLVDRAAIQSEFRTERDLFDRIDGGAGPGAVMAFLITGAGTSFGALAGILTIARGRVIALAVGTLWVGAVLFGWGYGLVG